VSEFRPFSVQHLVTLGVCGLAGWALIGAGRAWKGTEKEMHLGLVWGGFSVCANLWSWVYWTLPPVWNIRMSLPIQLCDFACLAAPLALITRWRIIRSMLFYWGIGLSSQAFITPTVQVGFESERFWSFWVVHFVIVGTALYEVIVRDFRPTWADFRRMLIPSAAYVALVLVVNWRLDSNYGYLGDTLPENKTIIDALGPWPWRIFIVVAIGVALMGLLTWIGRPRGRAVAA